MLRLGTPWLALPLLLLASAADAQVPPPNFVLIVTDDQRFDSLPHMPQTLAALAANGVTFSRAFVTNPVCAPSRASLLSGGHVSHSTGVVDNVLPNGGISLFDDTPSLATALQGAGYATGLFGKYMNEYSGPAIPPGWTRFEAGQSLMFASAVPAYSDGVDNDQDGATDLADAGCASPTDVSEQISGFGCDDGSDNVLDGLVDLADPGCESPYDSLETTNAIECDDGIDNDNDTRIEWLDPQRTRSNVVRERRLSQCGLGVELVLVLLALGVRRRRLARRGCKI